MNLTFNDLYSDKIIDCNLLVVCGKHSLFNNIAIDRIKDDVRLLCEKQLGENIGRQYETQMSDMGVYIDFDKFMEVNKVPPFIGKWFCNVNYSILTAKQKKQFMEYIKINSSYGKLVIEINDFMDFRKLLNNRVIRYSKTTNLISLSFPSRKMVRKMVGLRCKENGISLADKALDLFVMRMSDNYDEYERMISIVLESGLVDITFNNMKGLLKGIENYAINDFLMAILRPPRSRRSSKKKLYNMMSMMIEDIGAVKLINSLKRNIDTLIKVRGYINQGYIPGRLKYSIKEFKEKLPEDCSIGKLSDYVLKKNIAIANNSSIRDLMFIKLMLENRRGYSKESCEISLIRVIHRALISSERLPKSIGITNDIDEELYQLNRVFIDVPRDFIEEK